MAYKGLTTFTFALRYGMHRNGPVLTRMLEWPVLVRFDPPRGFRVKSIFKILATAAALIAVPASAAVIGDFRLDGNLNNAAGGALTLTNNGGTLGATGISFAANQGPTISGFSNPMAYSVEMAFSLINVNGYRKLLDFQNRSSDAGLYVLSSVLNFYPVVNGPSGDFAPNQVVRVVLTHDGAATTGFVGNDQRWTFSGFSNNYANISTILQILRDDFATGQGEASGGFLDYVRVYDTALSASQVAALTAPGTAGGVPEPAAWAMMLTGFGLVGGAVRSAKTRRVNLIPMPQTA
jgi:hypothetical protein